jgi:hypothetical protein
MWLLAQTVAAQEFVARDRLARHDIDAYVPTFRRTIKPRHVKKPRIVSYPLLPRYLFLPVEALPVAFEAMRHHDNIWPVKSVSRACLIVPDHDIEILQARTAAGEFDQLPPAWRFPVGTYVAFTIAQATLRGVVVRRSRVRIDIGNCSLVTGVDMLKLAEETPEVA